MSNKATKKHKIIALAGFIAIFIGLLFFLFYGENFNVLKEIFRSSATKEEIQDSIGKLGYRAYLVVLILSMLQVVLTFVPAEPLHVISGISFGLWKGALVCLLGIMIGNTIIFVLYKIFGKKLKDYFSTNIDIDFDSAGASNKLALIVIILYCLPAIPYGIICFFAASMGMKYPKYILITGIGSIPSLILDVGLGHIAMSTSWIVSIIVFAVIVVLLILMYKYKTQIFNKVNEYIRKNKEKEKNKVGNFNHFVNDFIGSVLVYSAIRSKVKIKLKNNVEKLEKPCIVLCNHGSFYDFVYSGKLLRKYRPHFIVARMYFHHKMLGKIISGTGAFPKSMFSSDIENSKNCLKVINSGGMLAMMPEARLSTIGKFEDIQDATYKFIKKMNVAVYTIKISGSYLAKPKWGDKVRKGSFVEAELNELFKAGETKEMDISAIQSRINSALDYNEWAWLESHPEIKYRHKTLAKGLENILSICPNCKEKFTLETDKTTITCSHCGLQVKLDNRYGLSGVEFKNIAEWYEWQKEQLRKELKSKNYCLESKVELRHLSKDGKSLTRPSGFGLCRLDKTGLTYNGTEDGKEIEKFFPIDCIYRLLFGAGEDFEIYEGKELYYFIPEDKRSAVVWYIVSELLKEN